jgi:hypothetical protein
MQCLAIRFSEWQMANERRMHLPFALALKSAKPSLCHRRMHWPCHWPANAFAFGECGVFANSLKRIGKWQMANAFAIRFSEWQGLWRMRRIRHAEFKPSTLSAS